MIRLVAISLALMGCTPPKLEKVYDQTGQEIDVVYLVQQPLCLFLCSQSTSTVGSDTDTIGGSSTNTQTGSATSGGIN